LTRAKEVSLLVGFHSGSKTNELATKKGQFDQVIGSYDSNDTDTSQQLDDQTSPTVHLFGINLVTFPPDLDSRFKKELSTIFILMSIGFTQLFSFTSQKELSEQNMLSKQSGLAEVCLEFDDYDLVLLEPFTPINHSPTFNPVGPMEAGLQLLTREVGVVLLRRDKRDFGFIAPLQIGVFLPRLLPESFSNPFPVLLNRKCPTVASGTTGMCQAYFNGKSFGFLFVFPRDPEQAKKRESNIITLYHEVGSPETSPFTEKSQQDLERLFEMVQGWIDAEEVFGTEMQVD
ncbi:hypothetical protein JCM5350_005431, partial [Sporobolomyces pararoseus]